METYKVWVIEFLAILTAMEMVNFTFRSFYHPEKSPLWGLVVLSRLVWTLRRLSLPEI